MIQELNAFLQLTPAYTNLVLLASVVGVGYCVRLARSEVREARDDSDAADRRIEDRLDTLDIEHKATRQDVSQVIGYIKATRDRE